MLHTQGCCTVPCSAIVIHAFLVNWNWIFERTHQYINMRNNNMEWGGNARKLNNLFTVPSDRNKLIGIRWGKWSAKLTTTFLTFWFNVACNELYTRSPPHTHIHSLTLLLDKKWAKVFFCAQFPLGRNSIDHTHACMTKQRSAQWKKYARFELIFGFFGDMKNWLDLSPFAVAINRTCDKIKPHNKWPMLIFWYWWLFGLTEHSEPHTAKPNNSNKLLDLTSFENYV